MARVNVYLPAELAEEAREAGLNVSSLAQEAIRDALQRQKMRAWLDDLHAYHRENPRPAVTHEQVMQVLDEAKMELWGE